MSAEPEQTRQSMVFGQAESSLMYQMDKLKQSLICPCCARPMIHAVTLFCQHTLCRACLLRSEDKKCFVCRLSYVMPREYNRLIDEMTALMFADEWQQLHEEAEQEKAEASREERILEEMKRDLYNQVVESTANRVNMEEATSTARRSPFPAEIGDTLIWLKSFTPLLSRPVFWCYVAERVSQALVFNNVCQLIMWMIASLSPTTAVATIFNALTVWSVLFEVVALSLVAVCAMIGGSYLQAR